MADIIRQLAVKTSAGAASATTYDIGSTAANVSYTAGTAGDTIGTTVQSALDYLNSNKIKYFATNDYTNSSTDFIYTGIWYTIPAHSIIVANARAFFSNSRPLDVAINTSSSDFNQQYATGSVGNGVMASAVYVDYATEAKTLYVWAKYLSVASNFITLTGFYIKE